ncbi:SH3 domain-containing protein [Hymenobacter sp. 15J16-1T3B]|uniref:SH3 domain-containing protein n=1 Tax=Hymenobacter sp. 15J16-1T3B TaxID=2886941 RepID=UPI001D12FAC0|nr:SH3 domain-containing protein [Hymenobacter sp. 15J16-1T3B]MCC3158584.1 SH3 domain-containing protein [Hymenobacter sp. 15J16-1T3B]
MIKLLTSGWLLLVSLVALAGGPRAAEVARDFEHGNALLARREYAGAVRAYEQLRRRGVERAELHCNAGIARYRLGQLGWAWYHAEKALQLAPWDAQLVQNRNLVQQALLRRGLLPIPVSYQRARAADVAGQLGLFGLVGTGALLLAALSLAAPRRARLLQWSRYGLLTCAALLALGATMLLHRAPAVVVDARVAGRIGPGPAARQLFTLQEGETVRLQASYAEWVKVQRTNGEEGWVMSRGVASLQP